MIFAAISSEDEGPVFIGQQVGVDILSIFGRYEAKFTQAGQWSGKITFSQMKPSATSHNQLFWNERLLAGISFGNLGRSTIINIADADLDVLYGFFKANSLQIGMVLPLTHHQAIRFANLNIFLGYLSFKMFCFIP